MFGQGFDTNMCVCRFSVSGICTKILTGAVLFITILTAHAQPNESKCVFVEPPPFLLSAYFSVSSFHKANRCVLVVLFEDFYCPHGQW